MKTEKGRVLFQMGLWSRLLAICVVLLCCVGVGIWWRMAGPKNSQTDSALTAGQSQAILATTALPTIRIELFEKDVDEILLIGTLGEGIDSARLGDWLQMQFKFPQAVYYTLIALNPTHEQESAVQFFSEQYARPVIPVRELRFPISNRDAFRLNDGVGQQAFVVIWSENPLPLTLTEASLAGLITWSPNLVDGFWRRDDVSTERVIGGTQQLTKSQKDRGSIERLWESEPTQLNEVINKLQRGFPDDSVHVTAVAFPVHESNGTRRHTFVR